MAHSTDTDNTDRRQALDDTSLFRFHLRQVLVADTLQLELVGDFVAPPRGVHPCAPFWSTVKQDGRNVLPLQLGQNGIHNSPRTTNSRRWPHNTPWKHNFVLKPCRGCGSNTNFEPAPQVQTESTINQTCGECPCPFFGRAPDTNSWMLPKSVLGTSTSSPDCCKCV